MQRLVAYNENDNHNHNDNDNHYSMNSDGMKIISQIELKLSEENGYYCKSAEDTR